MNRRNFLKLLSATPLLFVRLPKLDISDAPIETEKYHGITRGDINADHPIWRTVTFNNPINVQSGDSITVAFHATTSAQATGAMLFYTEV